jgi:hypothetical protein
MFVCKCVCVRARACVFVLVCACVCACVMLVGQRVGVHQHIEHDNSSAITATAFRFAHRVADHCRKRLTTACPVPDLRHGPHLVGGRVGQPGHEVEVEHGAVVDGVREHCDVPALCREGKCQQYVRGRVKEHQHAEKRATLNNEAHTSCAHRNCIRSVHH